MAAGLALFWDGAGAEITLTPLRQVVTAEAPVATYRVSNPSERVVEGRVDWLDLAATETAFAPASDAMRPGLSAAPYLEVSPAFFRLEPGAATTVRVSLRKGARPPAGERRSHLLIQTEAARTPLRKAGSGLELDIGLGVSTPVILRTGQGQARAAIGETRLLRDANGLLELETTLVPEGEFSAYGAIVLAFAEAGAPASVIAEADNIAAYLDAGKRRVTIPLGARRLPAGVLEIRYEGRAEYQGRLFDRRAFNIAPPE
ncbi:hypothetical protein [Amphiplicatus metriothermophilus]|uniref:Pili and flagellar-assembly chaperone, PapD N-terminal domain n=1 Tax=Amphiplicatus metriothermophilus TaxID=1519374 RepID=A0A239PY04_9PROT|nr:hypothetical protein [Amphiplicatus metriothermophilus]MBB5518961.1 hypothetical protein [Amphiplicatus metriothermophilus]SNT74547.1 hypothetical protein SAMN06297382_2238 [Amphiplicatus metriothermophilus]